MRFRLAMTAGTISLYPGGVVPVDLTMTRNGHELRVSIGSEDTEQGAHLECLAEADFDPPVGIIEAFECIAAERLPAGHKAGSGDYEDIDADGTVTHPHVLPLTAMPEAFVAFARSLNTELSSAIGDAVGVLRWRSRTLGPPRILATRGVEWSLDAEGDAWWHLPHEGYAVLDDQTRLHVTEPAAAEIQALLARDEVEPLAHALLREAWSLRRSHPRSSLLVGVAAVEVGVKHYIATCVPEAEWLADNMPSPPILHVIEDYLPTLEPPAGGIAFAVPDADTISVLRVAVRLRNTLAHSAGDGITQDRLHKTLRAVRNVLWSLDAARGHEWAAGYLSDLAADPPIGYRKI